MKDQSLAPAIILASCAAGPVFVIASTFAVMLSLIPNPVAIELDGLLTFMAFLLIATVVGAFIALVPVLIGANAMRALAERQPLARRPTVWTVAGGLGGAGLAWAYAGVTQAPEFGFGMIVTGALCGRICRFPLRWD